MRVVHYMPLLCMSCMMHAIPITVHVGHAGGRRCGLRRGGCEDFTPQPTPASGRPRLLQKKAWGRQGLSQDTFGKGGDGDE